MFAHVRMNTLDFRLCLCLSFYLLVIITVIYMAALWSIHVESSFPFLQLNVLLVEQQVST